MLRKIVLIICISLVADGAFIAHARKQLPRVVFDVHNRFQGGPKYLAENIEYISSKSEAIYHVTYHLHILPSIVAAMSLDVFDEHYLKAKQYLLDESAKTCKRRDLNPQNQYQDRCVIYLWTNLGLVPTTANPTAEHLSYARGIYLQETGQKPKFTWYTKQRGTQQQNNTVNGGNQ